MIHGKGDRGILDLEDARHAARSAVGIEVDPIDRDRFFRADDRTGVVHDPGVIRSLRRHREGFRDALRVLVGGADVGPDGRIGGRRGAVRRDGPLRDPSGIRRFDGEGHGIVIGAGGGGEFRDGRRVVRGGHCDVRRTGGGDRRGYFDRRRGQRRVPEAEPGRGRGPGGRAEGIALLRSGGDARALAGEQDHGRIRSAADGRRSHSGAFQHGYPHGVQVAPVRGHQGIVVIVGKVIPAGRDRPYPERVSGRFSLRRGIRPEDLGKVVDCVRRLVFSDVCIIPRRAVHHISIQVEDILDLQTAPGHRHPDRRSGPVRVPPCVGGIRKGCRQDGQRSFYGRDRVIRRDCGGGERIGDDVIRLPHIGDGPGDDDALEAVRSHEGAVHAVIAVRMGVAGIGPLVAVRRNGDRTGLDLERGARRDRFLIVFGRGDHGVKLIRAGIDGPGRRIRVRVARRVIKRCGSAADVGFDHRRGNARPVRAVDPVPLTDRGCEGGLPDLIAPGQHAAVIITERDRGGRRPRVDTIQIGDHIVVRRNGGRAVRDRDRRLERLACIGDGGDGADGNARVLRFHVFAGDGERSVHIMNGIVGRAGEAGRRDGIASGVGVFRRGRIIGAAQPAGRKTRADRVLPGQEARHLIGEGRCGVFIGGALVVRPDGQGEGGYGDDGRARRAAYRRGAVSGVDRNDGVIRPAVGHVPNAVLRGDGAVDGLAVLIPLPAHRAREAAGNPRGNHGFRPVVWPRHALRLRAEAHGLSAPFSVDRDGRVGMLRKRRNGAAGQLRVGIPAAEIVADAAERRRTRRRQHERLRTDQKGAPGG